MVSRKAVKVDKEEPLFLVFFLKDDEDQSVEVKEAEEIDFLIVKKRLEQGESVFITRKRKQKFKTSKVAREDAEESWYFTRI